jgi:hypothetical protein
MLEFSSFLMEGLELIISLRSLRLLLLTIFYVEFFGGL